MKASRSPRSRAAGRNTRQCKVTAAAKGTSLFRRPPPPIRPPVSYCNGLWDNLFGFSHFFFPASLFPPPFAVSDGAFHRFRLCLSPCPHSFLFPSSRPPRSVSFPVFSTPSEVFIYNIGFLLFLKREKQNDVYDILWKVLKHFPAFTCISSYPPEGTFLSTLLSTAVSRRPAQRFQSVSAAGSYFFNRWLKTFPPLKNFSGKGGKTVEKAGGKRWNKVGNPLPCRRSSGGSFSPFFSTGFRQGFPQVSTASARPFPVSVTLFFRVSGR